MKKIIGFLFLTLGLTTLVAFGQELTGDKLDAFVIWEKDHPDVSFRNENKDPDLEKVGEYCFISPENTSECNDFADKYNLHDEKEKKLAIAYEKVADQCGNVVDSYDCYGAAAPGFAKTIEAIDSKLAKEIKNDITKAKVFQSASAEGVTITLDGKEIEVDENNWEKEMAQRGLKFFEAMKDKMTEYAKDRASEFGMSPEEASKFMQDHFDGKMADFVTRASMHLENQDPQLLGPPIEIGKEGYPDYFTPEMQTQMENIFDLPTEELRQAAMKEFAGEHGMDGNYSDSAQDYQGWTKGSDGSWTSPRGETYSPESKMYPMSPGGDQNMWSGGDMNMWQAPKGGWSGMMDGGGAGGADFYNMSPMQMMQHAIDSGYMMPTDGSITPPPGYIMPTNYTPSALLYILLHLLR